MLWRLSRLPLRSYCSSSTAASRLPTSRTRTFSSSSRAQSPHPHPACNRRRWAFNTAFLSFGLTASIVLHRIHADAQTDSQTHDSPPKEKQVDSDPLPSRPGQPPDSKDITAPLEELMKVVEREVEGAFGNLIELNSIHPAFPLVDDALPEFCWRSSTSLPAHCGIWRYDTISGSFDGSQRTFVAASTGNFPSGLWLMFGIFPATKTDPLSPPSNAAAYYLYDNLLLYLIGTIGDLLGKYAPIRSEHQEVGIEDAPGSTGEWYFHNHATITEEPTRDEINSCLQSAFWLFDHCLCQEEVQLLFVDNPWYESESKEQHKQRISTSMNRAVAASDALVVLYQPNGNHLRVLNTGSSVRAILGVQETRLSPPQDPNATRSSDAHVPVNVAVPNNSQFGDSQRMGKWSPELERKVFDAQYAEPLVDPPPIPGEGQQQRTAVPAIATTSTQPGDFLILTTGLGDVLTDTEMTDIVSKWIAQSKPAPLEEPLRLRSDAKETKQDLQLPSTPAKQRGLGTEVRTEVVKEGVTRVIPSRHGWNLLLDDAYTKNFFGNPVVPIDGLDQNAAAHLARRALMALKQKSRQGNASHATPDTLPYRDDISVVVIFF
ncbi:hypothetical protein BDN72DRAFT_841524 [Pluteus cervinus]|uniref:Uncharacterized protein n=1 Tax=Pluteus cervinus TaxID=181527 RepID=A0ACD3ASC4_9AGAR|nr:hypothetical protein BDN72DRAFT_841524 [Pluteus cervinus]